MSDTPLRRQYLEIKRRYPHAILFFRLGDFYETFDDDAVTAARELEITLTSRPMSKGQRVPLAGIPHHALDAYLGKLIAKGYKVAICEQMERPQKGRKIVEREVVRVVTPGTVLEDNLLNRGTNNFLVAIASAAEICGLAYVDVSTGEFCCTEIDRRALAGEIERLSPAEMLLPEGEEPPAETKATVTSYRHQELDDAEAARTVMAHFATNSLDGVGLAGRSEATRAVAAILNYVRETQRIVLGSISRIRFEERSGYAVIDQNTRRNLELFRSLRADGEGLTLLSVLDQTKTAMGARLIRGWLGQPLMDAVEIVRRQDGVQFFFESPARRARVSAVLAKVPDLERVLSRVSAAAAALPGPGTPRDLVALRSGLESVPALKELLDESAAMPALRPCRETTELIAAAIVDDPQSGAVVRPGFSAELDELRATASEAREYLAGLERRERERTGIQSLKVGYNRVFGYFIEVTKANAKRVPEDYRRKQTLVGGERYTIQELQDLEYRVLHAQEREEEVEQGLIRQVCAQVAEQAGQIVETARSMALIDVYCGLGEAASKYGYSRPVVDEGTEIAIRDGRHPVVERVIAEGTFVPNDVLLDNDDCQVMLLTGPNMAGKSTYLRQAALITLMAQIGSFVPAAEARIGIVDRIFSRVGALDDINAGHSTFMVEMLETATILHNATRRSLLVFDEIGRGTSTYDGMAIARAVVEFIHNRPEAGAKTLFATHYHELTELAALLPRVQNYNVGVVEEGGRVVFLHRILPGGADKSYGVHVAQLAGLPKPVVARAWEILSELEANPVGAKNGVRGPRGVQLALAPEDGTLRREIAGLEMDGMTPLQAMTKLYELVERAKAPE